jgi:hypothetical protein
MKVIRVVAILLVIAALCVVSMFLNPPRKSGSDWTSPAGGSAAPAKGPTDAAPPKADPVVATVNGEAIRESDLAIALPKGSFGMSDVGARVAKLHRLAEALCVRQFLRKAKVAVSEPEIDKEVQSLRETPPTAGCACCRYASLEQFMQANNMDMKELRGLLANDLGMRNYLLAQWAKEGADAQKQKEDLDSERPRLEQDYVKAAHIFFNVFQNPLFGEKPDEVRKAVGAKAQAAWERLKKGTTFDMLAKEVSEDAVSRPNGGELGCVPPDVFGQTFADAVTALKPGECSKPVESPWGFHIIKREAMNDNDVLGLLKGEFLDTKHAEAMNEIHFGAKIAGLGADDTEPDAGP